MGLKKSAYFLVHRDTGQRYPIKGPVIIGRTRGDIVFSSDTKLSLQHCVVEPVTNGLNVRDLKSVSGTRINGKTLAPERDHFLNPHDELSVGEQAFLLQSVTRTTRVKSRKRKSKQKSGDGLGLVLFILAIGLGFLFWKFQPIERVTAPPPSPNQLGEIFEAYQNLQTSFERQTAPPQMVADRIEEKVLSPLNTLSRRWNAIGNDVKATRFHSSQVRFASALTGHAKAQVAFVRTGESKYSDEMDQWADQLEPLVSEMRAQLGTQFPTLVQSPMQIVEREFRQALREYRTLGSAVESFDLNDKIMNERIRENLIPKFTAVYARLGAIAAQNDFETRKVSLQRKLAHAVLEQLKALSLYSVSKDAKYAREMELWGNEIRRANESLKQATHSARAPASSSK